VALEEFAALFRESVEGVALMQQQGKDAPCAGKSLGREEMEGREERKKERDKHVNCDRSNERGNKDGKRIKLTKELEKEESYLK
jgi:hypothetical protein